MIIIDASLAFEIAISTKDGDELSEKIIASRASLAAPEIIDLEVLQTLRRFLRQGQIDETRAENAIRNFDDLAIEKFSHTPLQMRIWSLRDNLTAYDAAYFALAELLDAPLWTRDEKFHSVPGHAARIEVL